MGIQNKEYCGTIVLEINGTEYEVKSVDPTTKTNRKVVKTMNRENRALGTACGSAEHDIKIEAAIPMDGTEPDWDNMEDATVTIYPACGTGGKREIYSGCYTTEVGAKYKVDDEAVRSISMVALKKQVV